MRKHLFSLFAAATSIFFASCSSDDNGDTLPIDGALIKNITYTTYGGSIPATTSGEFHYSGNNLESLTAETTRIEIVYSGNKVSETRHFANDVLVRINTYTYDGNNLEYVTSDDGERIHYTYNGEVLSQATSQLFDEDFWSDLEEEDFDFSQGNLVQKTRTAIMFGSYQTRTDYTMDNKKNPTLAMNPYLRMTLNVPGIHLLSNNNASLAMIYAPASSVTPSAVQEYEYVYNSDDYPTSIIVKQNGQLLSETLIEYL